MLSSKNRIKKNKDFEIIHRQGNFFSFGNVFLKIRQNKIEQTRVGISVGLKFSKKAVERNAIKRKLGEVARNNLGKIKEGFDLVLTVRKYKEKKISSHSLEKDFLEVLKKANLITK